MAAFGGKPSGSASRIALFDEPAHGSAGDIARTPAERTAALRARAASSTQSIESMLRLGSESEAMASATLVELHEQTRKIEAVNAKLDVADAELVRASKHLNSIESIFGGIRNLFVRKPPTSLGTSRVRIDEATRASASASATGTASAAAAASARAPVVPPVRTHDAALDAELAKQDEALDQLSAMLQGLTVRGRETGHVLDSHLVQLEDVEMRVERTGANVRKATGRIDRVLH